MNRLSYHLIAASLVASLSSSINAQYYYNETIIQSVPTYSTPVYESAPIYHTTPIVHSTPVIQTVTDPVAACCGGSTTTGSCDCKNLGSCELHLMPPNCRKSTPTIKTPIPYEVFGKIPKQIQTEDCLKLENEFKYVTKVPMIICKTTTCKEIGTKTIECAVEDCKPGCYFRVCIPINDCITKTVECSLVDREMPHRVFQRTESSGRIVYDVYVINTNDTTSQFHAGGMPAEWLVMHCATKVQVQAKFPNMVAANRGKEIEPSSTEADVEIELVVDKEMLKKLLDNESQGKEDGSQTDSAGTTAVKDGLSINQKAAADKPAQPESIQGSTKANLSASIINAVKNTKM